MWLWLAVAGLAGWLCAWPVQLVLMELIKCPSSKASATVTHGRSTPPRPGVLRPLAQRLVSANAPPPLVMKVTQAIEINYGFCLGQNVVGRTLVLQRVVVLCTVHRVMESYVT